VVLHCHAKETFLPHSCSLAKKKKAWGIIFWGNIVLQIDFIHAVKSYKWPIAFFPSEGRHAADFYRP
jgi:hypothetical protein